MATGGGHCSCWQPVLWTTKGRPSATCAGLSVGQHLLAAYLKSLRAVLRVQFTHKGLRGGRSGVARLVEDSPVVQVPLNIGQMWQCTCMCRSACQLRWGMSLQLAVLQPNDCSRVCACEKGSAEFGGCEQSQLSSSQMRTQCACSDGLGLRQRAGRQKLLLDGDDLTVAEMKRLARCVSVGCCLSHAHKAHSLPSMLLVFARGVCRGGSASSAFQSSSNLPIRLSKVWAQMGQHGSQSL